MSVLRKLIKEIVQSEINQKLSEETVLLVSEYVGANIQIPIEKCIDELQQFVKNYKTLYRVWSNFKVGTPISKIENEAKIKLQQQGHFSSSKSLQAVIELSEENLGLSENDLVITKFSAKGFDPYEIIRKGILLYPNSSEIKFMKTVISYNEYQKEIIVLEMLSEQKLIDTSDFHLYEHHSKS